MLKKIVSIIADQHNAGIKQADNHPRNFLSSGNKIYAIDGGGVDIRHIGKSLSKTKSLKNLGLFFSHFHPTLDALIPTAFPVYAKQRHIPLANKDYRQLMGEIKRQRIKEKKTYLKKIFRECTAFVKRKKNSHHIICNRNYYTKEMVGFINEPETLITNSRVLEKNDLFVLARIDIDGQALVVKQYNIKNNTPPFIRNIHCSPARLSWKNAHLLTFLGVPTPKPVMFMEKKYNPLGVPAYFVMEYEVGVDSYYSFTSNILKGMDPNALGGRFSDLLQRLADASITHGDLKADNFLVSDRGLYLVNLETLSEHQCRRLFKQAYKKDCRRLIESLQDLPQALELFSSRIAKLEL